MIIARSTTQNRLPVRHQTDWVVYEVTDEGHRGTNNYFEGFPRDIVREFSRVANSDAITHVYPKVMPLTKAVIVIKLAVMPETAQHTSISNVALRQAAQIFADHFDVRGDHAIRSEAMRWTQCFRIYIEDKLVERRARCRECVLPILWRKQRRDLCKDAKVLIARAVWATRRSDEWEADQEQVKGRLKVE